MPLQIDQITPTLTATISIYATNNTRIPPLRQPYPPNHLIIPHSTVLSVSRREQSQPVETNTALSRRQCPIRGTSRSFSPPSPPPLPARPGERHDEFDFGGGSIGVPVCFFPLCLSLSPAAPVTSICKFILPCASVRAPAYTRSSAGPSRACCRCSGEGHKLNDVNALSTLCRRGETTHDPLSPSTHPYHPHFSVPLSLHRPSSDLDDPRQPLTRPLLTDYNYRGVPCGSPRMDEEER